MASNSFFHLAFLSYFSLLLCPPQQTSAATRSPFLPKDNHYGGSAPPAGLCSTAINKHGYKCQEFHVTTDDGYVLSVQRIPEGRAGGGGKERPPVLLQHGILMDGMTWVAGSPKESLAMILADNGFDVWISNIRGTRFSRRHLKLNPKNSKFWDWTWDDLVAQDVPAITHLVFKQTGRKTHFLGHSMGTLMALASLSEGKLNNVKSAALLSPIAHLRNLKTTLTIVAAKSFLGEIGTMFGMAEFNPRGKDEATFLESLCAYDGLDYDALTITALTGKNCCLNETSIQNFIKKQPQSTSTKTLVHFSQTIRHGILSKYDYGNAADNMEHYGKLKPPVYNLSKIPSKFPLFISHGGEDALSTVKDVATLLDNLKSHDKQKLEVLFIKKYAHLDFVMGMNAKDILYKQIVDFFRRHK